MAFNFIFRLIIWLLLTADLSWFNIVIGVIVVTIIPHSYPPTARVREWFQALWQLLIAIPQAYWEAIEMMIYPHTEEEIILEKIPPNRSSRLIFLDIFRITFTPKTIVVKYKKGGFYAIHQVRRKYKAIKN
ncbi:MAG: cation:proton antiporter [Microcystaceae cyanobacterium]